MSGEARAMGPNRRGHEKPVEGWKAIAGLVELTIPTAWRMARRNRDPMPVWAYLHTVLAWPSALKEWRSRQMLPVPVADAMRAIGSENDETNEKSIRSAAKNKPPR
jgi:hypothetical protein